MSASRTQTQQTAQALALRASVQRLSLPKLRRASKAAYKLYTGFVKDLTTEERVHLQPLYDHLIDTWTLFYREEERRSLLEAERKDRGEVLFTVFFPRQHSWERQKVITRSPHRKIESSCYSEQVHVSVVRPDDWLTDFRKAQVAS